MHKGVKIIGVVKKKGARRHSNRLESLDSVGMLWKYDTTLLEGREDMAGHPLDRNRFQIQGTEGMDKRKGGIWWIGWEAKAANLKNLQPLKMWKDIYRAACPLGQLDFKSSEGVGDMQTRRLHKVEYSNRICKVHRSEIGRGTSAD